MTKQKQIHKGKMSLEPSSGHIDTKNRKFPAPSMRVLTQYYSVFYKKTPVLSKHPNIHRYI